MGNVQRWYVYLVSAVTIQAVTWATINLIRNLLVTGVSAPTTAIAFQISVIVIALPLFLVHWLWAQRKAVGNVEERASFTRLLYLYVMMTAFLVPLVNNAFAFIRALLQLALDVAPRASAWQGVMVPQRSVWYNLVPLIVLALLWFYHQRVRAEDEKVVPTTEVAAVIRQLYVYIFTTIGITLAALASINLVRGLLVELFPSGASLDNINRLFLASEIARAIIGLSLWLSFWYYAQKLFYGPDEQERQSLVRKAYLYLIIFATVLTVVTTVTIVLSDVLKQLMDVPTGGGDIREAISIIIVAGIIWAYHAFVLRRDAAATSGKEQQANMRRIYLYLTAGIGLAAVLTGLVGDLNALIRALSSSAGFILELREQLAYFTAVLIAGLPLWLANWSRAQQDAHQSGSEGQAERHALMRRFYLYFYLFVATMAILGSAIYILSQIVELVLGARGSTLLFRDVGQALAYMIIAAAVWLYHGSILRQEKRLAKQEEAEKLRPVRVAVVDTGDGRLGQALVEELHRKVPSAQLQPLGLSQAAASVLNPSEMDASPEKVLANAEAIVGPWNMVVLGSAEGLISESIVHSITNNQAPKVFIPVRDQGLQWVGVENWKLDAIVKEVTAVVKQMAVGQEIKLQRRLGTASIVLIVLGLLFLFLFLLPMVFSLIFFFI